MSTDDKYCVGIIKRKMHCGSSRLFDCLFIKDFSVTFSFIINVDKLFRKDSLASRLLNKENELYVKIYTLCNRIDAFFSPIPNGYINIRGNTIYQHDPSGKITMVIRLSDEYKNMLRYVLMKYKRRIDRKLSNEFERFIRTKSNNIKRYKFNFEQINGMSFRLINKNIQGIIIMMLDMPTYKIEEKHVTYDVISFQTRNLFIMGESYKGTSLSHRLFSDSIKKILSEIYKNNC